MIMNECSAEELFEKLKNIHVDHPLCKYTLERCRNLAPAINRIQELKIERKAVVLAHSYVHPDIVYGVADFVGDSYALAKAAVQSQAETIVFPSVRFMAETVKILNPDKTVIDPNPNGGCSLADSITADEVRALRKNHPNHTFVCYVNTTAAVKAACDVCVTSSNVYRIMERLPTDKIFFLPDRLMGENVKQWLEKRGVRKEILLHPGTCYVHEQIEPKQIDEIRASHPNALVLAHPECKPEVVAKADYVGSTSDMQRYVFETQGQQRPFFLLTECGVASRVSAEIPNAKLVGGCSVCQFMRSNSLSSIQQALENPKPHQIVTIDPSIQQQAYKTLERMFDYAE